MADRSTPRIGAWVQIALGVGVIAWWLAAAVAGIPEIDEGRVDIWFHITAELVMAAMLIVSGGLSLARRRSPGAPILSGMALGALLYSAINSPGYFAERGEWWAVVMFGAVSTIAITLAVTLRRSSRNVDRTTGAHRRGRVRSGV